MSSHEKILHALREVDKKLESLTLSVETSSTNNLQIVASLDFILESIHRIEEKIEHLDPCDLGEVKLDLDQLKKQLYELCLSLKDHRVFPKKR